MDTQAPSASVTPVGSVIAQGVYDEGFRLTYQPSRHLPYRPQNGLPCGPMYRVPFDDWSTVATAGSDPSRASTTDSSVSSNATSVGSDAGDFGAFGAPGEDEVGKSDKEVSEESTSEYQKPLSESAASTRSESEDERPAARAQSQFQSLLTEEPAPSDNSDETAGVDQPPTSSANASNFNDEGNAGHIIQAQNAASGQGPAHPVNPNIFLHGPLVYSQAGLFIPPAQHSTLSAQHLVESAQQAAPVSPYHNPPPFQYQNSHHNQLSVRYFDASFRPQFDTWFNTDLPTAGSADVPVQPAGSRLEPTGPRVHSEAGPPSKSPGRPLHAPAVSPGRVSVEFRRLWRRFRGRRPAPSGVFSTGYRSGADDEYRPDSEVSGEDVTFARDQRDGLKRLAEERQRPAADRARRESAFSAAAVPIGSDNEVSEGYAIAAVTPSSGNDVYFSAISSSADPEDKACWGSDPEGSRVDEPWTQHVRYASPSILPPMPADFSMWEWRCGHFFLRWNGGTVVIGLLVGRLCSQLVVSESPFMM